MSLKNRKILHDKLVAEGKFDEASKVIMNHPEMVDEPEPVKRTRRKK